MSDGDKAWVGLAAYIFAYDVFATLSKKDTLSEAFDRALDHNVRSPLVIGVWAGITFHLFGKAARRTFR